MRKPRCNGWSLILCCALVASWICCACGRSIRADESAAEKPKVTFDGDVLPILKTHCFKCHAGAAPEHGLRLTSARELLRGGESGAAIRIAAAESSLLWEKLAANEMPKDGPPLTAEEKGVIRTWINEGAAAEIGEEELSNSSASADDSRSDHWAFQPPVRPPLPAIQHAER